VKLPFINRERAARPRETDPVVIQQRLNDIIYEGRHRRRRTVIMSVVASSIVALFIGWGNDYDQRTRSVKNCEAVQLDRRERIGNLRDTAHTQQASADFVLGSKARHRPVPNWHKQPFRSYATFRPLVTNTAKQARRESRRDFAAAMAIQKRLENCEKVFPEPNPIPFM
jgi:hypothetical protein